MDLAGYATDGFYDEMFTPELGLRAGAESLGAKLRALSVKELRHRQKAAELALLTTGVTFTVYSEESSLERIFPFDILPRIMTDREWTHIEGGLKQRIRALNLFIGDIYGDRKTITDGVIPWELIESCRAYRPQCVGLTPPGGIWCHVTGTDLVRHSDGRFYVLEDNLRTPSGVSYMLENRWVMKRVFPEVFSGSRVRSIDDYPMRLLETLQWLVAGRDPTVVVLTPGIHNSAYFEHAFLAQQMGVELVQPDDLVVRSGRVHMRTTKGLRRVDVIYRRVDDDFLDPLEFRADSLLGIPGVMDVYRKGEVALANAPGNGIADDKVIYTYVPDLIRYLLGEEPILPNVPTHRCWVPEERAYVLDHIEELVVKAAGESGGYGMLVGPHATPEQRAEFQKRIARDPRNYIAQPTLSLSRVPTMIDDHLEGRHVDLRPYILSGESVEVIPGGLTRVALNKGSLVVNSSQGGGSKDTWIVEES